MAKKLDRSRDFGEVMGHDGGAAFVQDETLFDIDGNELVSAATKKPAAKKTVEKADPVVDQVAANLEGDAGDFAA